ncbi:MAG: hypothetical protein Q9191_001396 [Dirinaria sp. TL-2023a]
MDNTETPTATILLLGDPSCGKTTFLSRLSHGIPEGRSTLPVGFQLLRDLDQPFPFDIKLYNRPYRFEFYDTGSPTNYTLLTPDFVILCYDVSNRRSLVNAQEVWRKVAARHYRQEDDDVPIMLLGLKRDLRVEGPELIDPLEGLRIAQEMRCDRYAECSAMTGELMREVMQDVAKTAAKTTTEGGGLSQGGCGVM